MSAILALQTAHYIGMKNNAMMNMINLNNSRMSMISNPVSFMGNPCCSTAALCETDTQMELESATNSVQYMFAKAMLEQIKKLQKEETKNLDFLA